MNFKDLIEASTGEYVAYLDGDDLMLPGKIKFQIDFLDSNPDCNFCSHNMIIYDHESKTQNGSFSKIKSGLYDVGDLAKFGTFFANSSKMYRRACNEAYPYYEDGFKYVGDYIWHIYHVKDKKFGYVNNTFGIYRKHSQSASYRNNRIERIKRGFEYC